MMIVETGWFDDTSNHDCYEELPFQLQHRLALNPRPWQAASSNHQPNDQQMHRCSASSSTLLPNLSEAVANEHERRGKLNAQYLELRNLVPNHPTGKKDRLTTVEDAIEYIKELVRTVNELRSQVEKRSKEIATKDADKKQDINMKPSPS